MKIGEAQKLYSARLNQLWSRKTELIKQQKENEKSGNTAENQGVILELSMVEEQYDKAKAFMEKFMAYKTGLYNGEAARQQGEAMEESANEMAKCMEIARRISKGEKVPAYDEKKLLEYNYQLYMSAKNMAIMSKSDKKHKSLWEDEEEKAPGENRSPMEIVDDRECAMEMPSEISGDISVSE